MTMIIQIVTAIALILSIILPVSYFFLGEKNKKRYKRTLAANCFMFFGVILVASVVMFAGTSSVQYFRSWFRYCSCQLRKRCAWSPQRRRFSFW